MISFFVAGLPKSGGSKTAFYNKKIGRAIVVDACKGNKEWRAIVTLTAQQSRLSGPLMDGPLKLEVHFVLPRPQNHFRSNGQLKPNAPNYHTSKPDATKLLRAVEDALTNVLWVDDSRICVQNVVKVYGPEPGAHITVQQLKDED